MASATRPGGPRAGHLPVNTNNPPRAGPEGSRFPASPDSRPSCPPRGPRAGGPTAAAGPEDAPGTPPRGPHRSRVPNRTCQSPLSSSPAGGRPGSMPAADAPAAPAAASATTPSPPEAPTPEGRRGRGSAEPGAGAARHAGRATGDQARRRHLAAPAPLPGGSGPGRPRGPRRGGRAEPLPAPHTKRLRGSPPHLQHGAPRAFENHRTPLRRARHSPGLPVPPGAAAAAAISSRSPSPRPRCQVTPFTWAWSRLRRAAPPPRPLPPAPAETAQSPARPQPAHGPRQRRTAAWRIPPAPAPPPPRPHAPLALLAPRRHESEPVIGRSAAVKG